jgi:hypothetical protein
LTEGLQWSWRDAAGVGCVSAMSEQAHEATSPGGRPSPPDPKRRVRLVAVIGIIAGLTAVVVATAIWSGSQGPSADLAQQPNPPPDPTPPIAAPGGGAPPQPSIGSIIDAELRNLSEGGRIAYGVPPEMKAGIDSDVVLRISRRPEPGLAAGLPGPVLVEQVSVAPLMAAELRGREFDIDPEGRQDQIVPPEGFSEWRWSVVPESSGEKTLRFVVYVVLRLPDGSEEDRQIVKDKTVAVSVNPAYSVGNFLSENFASVLAVLTALFGSGWVLGFLKRRREATAARSSDGESDRGATAS